MPEENWTFGVGSVSVAPLCPLSASSTSSPLIAGWTAAVTVLILSLPLLGRKMCLNSWRYLFFLFVSIRWQKLSPRIMSPSLICLPVLSTIFCEVRCSYEMQHFWMKPLPIKTPDSPFLLSVDGLFCLRLWVTQDSVHSPNFCPGLVHSFFFLQPFSLSPLHSLPYPKFRILWCALTQSSLLPSEYFNRFLIDCPSFSSPKPFS